MKIRQLLPLFAFILCLNATAQLGVKETNTVPNAKAMLDVESTNKGVLIPRMSTAARNAIASPPAGLMIYNSQSNKFNYYDGAAWQETFFGNQWNINGSAISYSAGNVGIGTNMPNPSAKLDLSSTNSGVLVPRMTSVERNGIVSPATGLLVFDTTTQKFWFYNGIAWSKVAADNNVRFAFDLLKSPGTLATAYNLSYLENYNFDPTTVSLTNATTLQLQRAGLYHFRLLGMKHFESAASAVVSSATFNLTLTVNTKQYSVIANGVQVGGGSSWSYGSPSDVSFDLYIPSNSTLTFTVGSSTNSGFSKSDTGHFFGYLISD